MRRTNNRRMMSLEEHTKALLEESRGYIQNRSKRGAATGGMRKRPRAKEEELIARKHQESIRDISRDDSAKSFDLADDYQSDNDNTYEDETKSQSTTQSEVIGFDSGRLDTEISSKNNFMSFLESEINNGTNDMMELNDDFWHGDAAYSQSRAASQGRAANGAKNKKNIEKTQSEKQIVQTPKEKTVTTKPVTKSKSATKGKDSEFDTRMLAFNAEKSRVAAGVDGFVPGVTVSVDMYEQHKQQVGDLESQRENVATLKRSNDEARVSIKRDRSRTNAAVRIQAHYRGFKGRCHAAEVHSYGSYGAFVESQEQKSAWRQVCDPSTGDIWYYNTISGESTWEIPEELGAMRKSNASGASTKLPDVHKMATPRKNKIETIVDDSHLMSEKVVVSATSSTKSSESLPPIRQDSPPLASDNFKMAISSGIEDEIRELRNDDSDQVSVAASEVSSVWNTQNNSPRFFFPDGTTNVKLRETVRYALQENRFDSVSSLLVDQAQAASQAREQVRRDRKVLLGKVDDQIQDEAIEDATIAYAKMAQTPTTAAFKVGFKGKKSKQPKQQLAVNTTPTPKHSNNAPAIFDVSQAGNTAMDIASLESFKKEAKEVDSKKICFLCWSCGDDMVKRCDVHDNDPNSRKDSDSNGGVLTCANWNLMALYRKYRAEEIQETFAKGNAALRWDINRKRFITVVEPKHQVYRGVEELVNKINLQTRAKLKTWKWIRSVIDNIRAGQLKSELAQKRGSMWRIRNTIVNTRSIEAFTTSVLDLQPKVPVTYTKDNQSDELNKDGFLGLERGADVEIQYVEAPIAKPIALYKRHVFINIPTPRFAPTSTPEYPLDTDASVLERYAPSTCTNESETRPKIVMPRGVGGLLEQLAMKIASDASKTALREVAAIIPRTGQFCTAHAKATTDTFGLFGRMELDKTNPAGVFELPSATVGLSHHVTTAIVAQYGKFIVSTKTSVEPAAKRYETYVDADGYLDSSCTFRVYEPPAICSLGRTYTDVVSNLDKRKAPGIMCSAFAHEILGWDQDQMDAVVETSLKQKSKQRLLTRDERLVIFEDYMGSRFRSLDDDRKLMHYHGANRSYWTGESLFTGFRTLCAMPGASCIPGFETVEFVPSQSIALPNVAGIRGTVTSHADPSYPFCVPTSRDLGVLDRFHQLVSTECNSNSACCFTVMGFQDPGQFLTPGQREAGVGSLEMRVYRSFAYYQSPHIDEYKTVDGIPYWYNKKTGETYWTSPIIETNEESDEDDAYMDPREDKSTKMNRLEAKKHSNTVGPRKKALTQNQMRRHILKDYEENLEEEHTVEEEKYAAELEKAATIKRAQEQRFRERVGKVNIVKTPLAPTPLKPSVEIPMSDVADSRVEVPQQQAVTATPTNKATPKANRKKRTPPAEILTDAPVKINNSSKNQAMTPKQSATPKQAGTPSRKQKASGAKGGQENNDGETQRLISTISSALQSVMTSGGRDPLSADDLLKLGVGLGLGIGLGQQKAKSAEISEDEEDEEDVDDEAEDEDDVAAAIPKISVNKLGTVEQYSDSEGEEEEDALVLPTPKVSNVLLPSATPDEQGSSLSNMEHTVHAPAGEGVTWTAPGTAQNMAKGKLFKTSAQLPEGFIRSVNKPHTAKQHVDYLPSSPNLNEAKSVGVVKPRNMLDDWSRNGFNPWSEGKDQLITSFVPSLLMDEKVGLKEVSNLLQENEQAAVAERSEIEEKKKLNEDMELLFSWCRHNKYNEINHYLDDPDTFYPIDTKDSLGNTLLSIAAQNGNKRIVKMCLRRGAEINTQNLNGQSVLHYCFAYGFESLAEYLMQKGADDTLVNADGLTCYEGLSIDAIDNL